MAEGQLLETVVTAGTSGVRVMAREVQAGGSIVFAGRRVHDLVNEGAGVALTVHVYKPRLTAMTFYEVGAGELHACRVETTNGPS